MDEKKKIECYIDCVSPYSFHAFSYLRENRASLIALGVEVEFIPVFLGGINGLSGNKPPWTDPVKAAYSRYDSQRAQRHFGQKITIPTFFPILSLLPQRALTFAKQHYDNETFEKMFLQCFEAMWKEQIDISRPEGLSIALRKTFNEDQVHEIIKAADHPTVKKALTKVTEKVVRDFGAFGCPWFWVYDGKGNTEPFFGSDRFHYMWDYLDIPHEDLALRVKTKL